MTEMKACLVTGAASGIGRRLVKRLLEAGYRVLATDLVATEVESAAKEDGWIGSWLAGALDVRSGDDWDRAIGEMLASFGGTDILLNVAGVLKTGKAHAATRTEMELQLDVNVRGVMFGTQAASAWMVESGRKGHIVNISSLAGLAPIPGLSVYSASKFAVRAYSIAAAWDLEQHGIRVSVVCPDAVETPMLVAQVAHDDAALTFSGTPLTADDVCTVILEDVLPNAPLEVSIPKSRGAMARVAGMAPAVARIAEPMFRSKGEKTQARRRALN